VTEAFLHYIWQFQYFDKKNLTTTNEEVLHILKTGFYNTHAGPDFTNAKLRLGNLEWVGNVEIHVKSSEWTQHKHQHDKAYDNVVLHVVWKNDKDILRSDGTTIPTLELSHRIEEKLLLNYKKLVQHTAPIPCADSLPQVSPILKLSALERALTQRLETKAMALLATLKKNNNDWEETLYQVLGKNFGFKVNSEAFQQLTEVIPYRILLKHADKPVQIEALLFGTAGLLDNTKDEYTTLLRKEYSLLSTKYSLVKKSLSKSQWRFLRLRPANFPTIRIAQFASLLSQQKHLFSQLISCESIKELRQLLTVTQSVYWQQHYQFGKPSNKVIGALGDDAIENIVINTVAPLLAAYSLHKNEQLWMDRALDFLAHLPAESNAIIREWASLHWKASSAFDSQALIELKNNFCSKRLCLSCSVGANLVRSL
jgi:hypothetical protein